MMNAYNMSPSVLARATSSADVAELSEWKVPDLMAVAESGVESHLRAAFGASVRNRYIDAMRAADGSPHFTAELAGAPVAVYVLCVASVSSAAALSSLQYAWAEAHPAADILVLPCVVQHLRPDYARCVAEPPVALRTRGAWQSGAVVQQFLPPTHSAPHWLGEAHEIKWHTLIREVANNGTRIYPYIQGVAQYRDLPAGARILCSDAGVCPLLLVHTCGEQNGALRVERADFYSSDNAVNELEVYDTHPTHVELMDERGNVYRANCAELTMFPGKLKRGMHLRWAVSLVADSFLTQEQGAPCLQQIDGTRAEMTGVVKSVAAIQFSSMRGYCLGVQLHAKLPQLLFNLYVFEHRLSGKTPRVGEVVSAQGTLYAAPDALVESSTCWADSPQTDELEELARLESLAQETHAQLLPYGAPLAALATAFIRKGYTLDAPFEPLFRFGRPEFALLSPSGERLMVMVDTVVNQHEDQRGYRCRFAADKYPAHMAKTPQDGKPADICFVTLHLKSVDGAPDSFTLSAEQHGTVVSLSLPERMTMQAATALSEEQAAHLFSDCMQSQSFEKLLPCLREDVAYTSQTAELAFSSKWDLLRHLRTCFDVWQKRGVTEELQFSVQRVQHEGRSRFCCVATQQGELISATVFSITNAMIGSIQALAPGNATLS